MEKTLKSLFDFQKFEGNPALQQVIDSVHARYAVRELPLDEMDWVAAAGTPDQNEALKNINLAAAAAQGSSTVYGYWAGLAKQLDEKIHPQATASVSAPAEKPAEAKPAEAPAADTPAEKPAA